MLILTILSAAFLLNSLDAFLPEILGFLRFPYFLFYFFMVSFCSSSLIPGAEILEVSFKIFDGELPYFRKKLSCSSLSPKSL